MSIIIVLITLVVVMLAVKRNSNRQENLTNNMLLVSDLNLFALDLKYVVIEAERENQRPLSGYSEPMPWWQAFGYATEEVPVYLRSHPELIEKTVNGLVFRGLGVYGSFVPESLDFELNRSDERSASSDNMLGELGLVYDGLFLGWEKDAYTSYEEVNNVRCLKPHRKGSEAGHSNHDELVVCGQRKPVAMYIRKRSMASLQFVADWAMENGIRVIYFN